MPRNPLLPPCIVFDLDPAGIRIARLLEERSVVSLAPTGMTPELFAPLASACR